MQRKTRSETYVPLSSSLSPSGSADRFFCCRGELLVVGRVDLLILGLCLAMVSYALLLLWHFLWCYSKEDVAGGRVNLGGTF